MCIVLLLLVYWDMLWLVYILCIPYTSYMGVVILLVVCVVIVGCVFVCFRMVGVLWFGSILFVLVVLIVLYCFLEILENSVKIGFLFLFFVKKGVF